MVGIECNADTSLVLHEERWSPKEETRVAYASIDEITWLDHKRTVFVLGALGVGVYVALVFLFNANWY